MYHQFTITAPEPYQDALGARLIEIGSLGVEARGDALIAYFPETADTGLILRELDLLRVLFGSLVDPVALTVEHILLPDTDWNETWKKTFSPVDAGTLFTILPPWERPSGDRIPLIIDPGMAFGTGHHETTRSCIVLMERYAPSIDRARFLDLGTGTGLLAIAAQKLGFTDIIGVDSDPLAVEAAEKNLALNGAGSIAFFTGSIADAPGTYAMIAANLISGTLVELAGEIASRVRTPGVAILSGILAGQDDEVAEAMEQAGLVCVERLRDGKWISLACRR
ncbi:MAG: 50S ribosomal protein L11 methyltransferase [Nitrospirota bacterium]